MNRFSTSLLLSSIVSSSSAWEYYSGHQGFGTHPVLNNQGDLVFEEGNQNPNYTKSVPFQLDGQDFTLRVNISSITPYGLDDFKTDDRIVNSAFDLAWPGASQSLNDTMRKAQNLSDDQAPRLCVTMPLGVFPASVTNKYHEDDNGDCSGALGSKCVEAIKAAGYSPGTSCPGIINIPKECKDSDFPDGGFGSAPLIERNATSSPFGFAFESSPLSDEDNQDMFVERETERLNMFIFSGIGQTPVCMRVKDDHVDKKSIATAGAADLWSGRIWYAVGGLMAVVAFLV